MIDILYKGRSLFVTRYSRAEGAPLLSRELRGAFRRSAGRKF
jgi:hypothetical protein